MAAQVLNDTESKRKLVALWKAIRYLTKVPIPRRQIVHSAAYESLLGMTRTLDVRLPQHGDAGDFVVQMLGRQTQCELHALGGGVVLCRIAGK